MAIRSVLLNVSTNAASVGTSMQTLAAATREVGASYTEAAVAAAKAEAAEASLAAARARGTMSADEERAAQARLTAATDQAAAAAARHAAATDEQAMAMLRAGQSVGKVALVVGGVLDVALFESIKTAGAWQQKMEQVAIAGNLSAAGVKVISDALLDLSTRTPIAAGQLADAFAVIERQGYGGAQALTILQQAAEASVIGLGDVTTVARNVMAVMDAFSGQNVTAAKATDLLVAAFLHGQGSIDDFAKSLAQVAPVAGLAKTPINDVVAAMVAMTKEGLNTQQAAMALNRFMLQVINPTSELDKAMRSLKDAQGAQRFESGAQALQIEGLGGVMKDLMTITGGNVAELERLYPSVRAFRGVAALAADDGRNFADALKLMSDDTALAAAEQDAYAKQQATFSSQVTLAKNSVHQLSVEAGQVLLPYVIDLAKSVQGLVQWFGSLPAPVRTAAVATGALAAATTTLVAGFLLLAPHIAQVAPGLFGIGTAATAAAEGEGEATVATATLGASMSALMPWLIPIGIAMSALGFAVMNAAKNTAESKQAVEQYAQAWLQVEQGTQGAVEGLAREALMSDQVVSKFRQLGITLTDVTAIIKGGADASTSLGVTQDALMHSAHLTTQELQQQGLSASEISRVHKDLHEAFLGNTDAARDLNQALTGQQAGFGWDSWVQAMGSGITSTHKLRDGQQDLVDVLGSVAKQTKASKDGQALATEQAKELAAAQGSASYELAHQGAVSDQTAAQIRALGGNVDQLTDSEKQLQKGIQGFLDTSAILDRATADMKSFTDAQGVATDLISSKQKEAQDAAEAQAKAYNDSLKDQNQATSQNISDMAQAAKGSSQVMSTIAETNIHNAKYQASQLKDTNADQTKTAKDFLHDYQLNAADWTKALQKTATDTDDWRKNLATIAAKGGPAVQPLIDALTKMGKDGVPLARDFAQGTVQAMQDATDAIKRVGPDAQVGFDAFANALQKQLADEQDWSQNLITLSSRHLDGLVNQFIAGGPKTAQAAKEAVAKTNAGVTPEVQKMSDDAMRALDLSDPAHVHAFQQQIDSVGKLMAGGGTDVMDKFINGALSTFGPDQGAAIIKNIADQIAAAGHGDIAVNLRVEAANQGAGDMPTGSAAHPGDYLRPMQGHFASGSIVKYFAEGHAAEIAPMGVTRVWNEPEAGGEAYIPLSPSKAARSTAIWREVGRILATHNDDGNIYPAYSPMVNGGAPVSVSVPAPVVHIADKPVSRKVSYFENATIKGPNITEVVKEADRRQRLTALGGGAGLGAR